MFGCSGDENAGRWFVCHPLHKKNRWILTNHCQFEQTEPPKSSDGQITLFVSKPVSLWFFLFWWFVGLQKKGPSLQRDYFRSHFFQDPAINHRFHELKCVHTSRWFEFFTGETTVSSSLVDCLWQPIFERGQPKFFFSASDSCLVSASGVGHWISGTRNPLKERISQKKPLEAF